MILRYLLVALGLQLCSATQAADAQSCGDLPCRANGLPYVTAGGTIIILPGEAFSVEFKLDGDKLVALVPRKGKDVPNSVTLELLIKNGTTGLIWGNQLDRPVRLDATSTAPQREVTRLECPLPPKRYTYQVWTFVAEAVEVGNFSFTQALGARCD
jgi:hypothetical protein